MTGASLHDLAARALFNAALYYLFARAEITRALWSRYPAWLDRLALCPACSGFWIGLLTGLPWARPWPVGESGDVLAQGLTSGLLALVTTPILFGALRWGLDRAAPRENP